MCKLRTLLIRNMPSLKGDMDGALWEGLREACANTVLQMLFPQGNRKVCWRPTLQLLGIGLFSSCDYQPRLFRLHIYRFATWSLLDGQQRLHATLTEAGTYRETEAAGGDITVFKCNWSR